MDGTAAWKGMRPDRARELFERYGTRAELISGFIGRASDAPLNNLPSYSQREIAFLAQHEKIIHLDDLLLRRSMLAMLGRLKRNVIEEIAEVLAECLKWTADQKDAEVARTLKILADKHEVTV
jgi:glycerol-3-phosphate dehydrogenase